MPMSDAISLQDKGVMRATLGGMRMMGAEQEVPIRETGTYFSIEHMSIRALNKTNIC